MKTRLLLICASLAVFACCYGQAYKSVFILRDHNSEHISEYYSYWLQPFEGPENPAVADSMFAKGAFVHWKWHSSLSLGDARKRLWIRVVVKNESPKNGAFVWSIHDFVDTANLYVKNGSAFYKADSATYWIVAPNREFPARPLCLPFTLQYGETKLLYLCLDQHYNNVYFPMKIRNVIDFWREEHNFLIDQYWFWLIGFYIFSMVFNLILFSFLRDRIYLWYTLYVLFNTIFLLMEDSLDGLILPQWFYSFIWHAGQYTFLMLSAACGIKIMQIFTGQKAHSPKLYWAGNAMMGLTAFFALLIFVAENYLEPSARLAVVGIIKTNRDLLIFCCLLFIVVSLVSAFVKGIVLARYYSITYSFFFVSCMMFMFNHLGLTSINLVEPNILAWGLFFELLTLSILLTGRFKAIIYQSEALKVRNIDLEKTQVQKLLETQETERKRMAEDLHDDVGPTMSALLLHISNVPAGLETNTGFKEYFDKALGLSAKASADIRNISHELMPKDFADLGLFRVLENRASELNALQNIRFNTILFGDENKVPKSYGVIIYRILAELMLNIIKHSQASQADIQVLVQEEDVQLLTEDNGIGIQNAIDKKGIGLKNVMSRVEFLKGTCNIDSGNRGTSIIIIVPLANDNRQ